MAQEASLKAYQGGVVEEETTKMLGAHVPEELYWEFKNAAAKRKEPLKDAIAHAARMYIDSVPSESKQ